MCVCVCDGTCVRFCACMSCMLQVGEHIPPHLEAAFLGNLIRHARRGLVLSWAVPGQVRGAASGAGQQCGVEEVGVGWGARNTGTTVHS